MIYQMVESCIASLVARWIDLREALVVLCDGLAANRTQSADQINVLLMTIDEQILVLENDNPLVDNQGRFAPTQQMLRNAQEILNASRDLPVDGSNTSRLLLLLQNMLVALLSEPGSSTVLITAAQSALNDLQQHIESCLRDIEELTTAEGISANIGGINRSVENISAYPVLTQESSYSPSSPATNNGGVNARSLTQTAENALRDVLGWRPKSTDAKGFVAALTQSFTCKEVEGHTECVYTPRTYAIQVQADLGAITGAQASIYARAKVALEQSLLILDRLYPLDAAFDDQNVEASRSIVRTELTELVNELGVEGGPRVERVDSLFDLLRGEANTAFAAEEVGGQLQVLGDVFGLVDTQVNTVEEEQNLTDFITLVDYVNTLYQSWTDRRRFFDRSSSAQPFLGTQLVLVARALAVVSESVHEIYYAMDSVFLGGAERQTIELRYNNFSPIFVSELLAWVDRFASDEAPMLIQDGGKAGVRALFPTIDRLTELVRNAQIPPQEPNRLPAAYRTSRVQRAFQELATHLGETANLARDFVQTVSPTTNGARNRRLSLNGAQPQRRFQAGVR